MTTTWRTTRDLGFDVQDLAFDLEHDSLEHKAMLKDLWRRTRAIEDAAHADRMQLQQLIDRAARAERGEK